MAVTNDHKVGVVLLWLWRPEAPDQGAGGATSPAKALREEGPSTSSVLELRTSRMYKLGFKEEEEPEVELPTSIGSLKKQEGSRKTSTSALLTAKAFDCVDHNKL